MFIAVDLSVNTVGFSVLVPLADKYLAATTDVQRAAYIATADLVVAVTVVGTTVANFAVSAGTIILALIMRKSRFGKPTAYLGLAAGVGTVVGTVATPGVGIGFVAPIVIVAAWAIVLGSKLWRMV